MDINFLNDVPMTDPFRSLETNLDDISHYLGPDRMDFEMDQSWQQPGSSHQTFQMSTTGMNDGRNQNQHSPPQEFYDPEGTKDVSSLTSLLNRPVEDYYSMRFSPPNFDMNQQSTSAASSSSSSISLMNSQSLNGPARMLSNLSTMTTTPQMSLVQQLSAPAMQPVNGNLMVNTNENHLHHSDRTHLSSMLSPPHEQIHDLSLHSSVDQKNIQPPGYLSPPHFYHQDNQHIFENDYSLPIHQDLSSPTQQSNGSMNNLQQKNQDEKLLQTETPINTKEELLRMLANMSPSEVEKLKSRKTSTSSCNLEINPIKNAIKIKPTKKEQKIEQIQIDQQKDGGGGGGGDEEDDDDEDEDSGESNSNNHSNHNHHHPPVKRERRTAHNLIEKKYRCSINDRIQHLKVILAGEEAKLSKSATLRKAIDFIQNLENENQSLKNEVEKLRSIISANGLPYPQPETIRYSTSPDYIMKSPLQSSPSPPRNEKKRARISSASSSAHNNGGNESSRVTLFAMLLAVLIFNPLGLIAGSVSLQSASAHDKVAASRIPVASPFEHGRVLDDFGNSEKMMNSSIDQWRSTLIRPIFVWIINIFVILCVLMRLLVYGEPVQDFKSLSWTTFVTTREKARKEVQSGNLKEAQRQFCECLMILDRQLPSQGIDGILSVVWEIIRHLLNWVWIGRWISRRKRSKTTPVSVVCRSHAHTAVLYHEVHQLHLMGIFAENEETNEFSSITGLYLALSAVNLAESAGASIDGLPRSIMAQIYLLAAIRCRLSLPKIFAPIVAGYFMRRARRHIRRAPEHTVSNLLWLFHPATRKYMADAERLQYVLVLSHKLKFGSFVTDEMMSPLSRLRASFKIDLLSKLVYELAGGEELNQISAKNLALSANDRLDDEIDIVDISRLLVSISTKSSAILTNEKDESTKFGTWLSQNGDACCTWWTHVLTCGIYWRSGKNELARKHYSLIRNCPPEILKDYLGLSVGHALCARKICIDDRESTKVSQFVCMHSKKSLESLRRFSISRTTPSIAGIQEGVRRMTYEWIMSSLLDAWRTNLIISKPYWIQHFKGQQYFSTIYQEAYNHYSIINGNRGDCWRLFVYELTSRMLNGANPQATWLGIRRVRTIKMNAVRGRVSMKRSTQPDAFHLHTLCKLHSSMDN